MTLSTLLKVAIVVIFASIFVAVTFLEPPAPESWETSLLLKGPNGARGSGVYIGNGQVLTAKHMIEQIDRTGIASYSAISYMGESYAVTTSSIWHCKNCDLAIIGVTTLIDKDLSPAVISCRVPERGESVSYSGYPISGTDEEGEKMIRFITATGIVADERLTLTPIDKVGRWLANIYFDHGGSGSGIFDSQNHLIGVAVQVSGMGLGQGIFIAAPMTGVTSILPYCDPDWIKSYKASLHEKLNVAH